MPQPRTSTTRMSRRGVLQLGLGAAAVLGVGGCSSGGASGGGGSAGGDVTLPKYIAPKDIPGVIKPKVEGVPLGYKTYPEELFASVPEGPGATKPIRAYTITWGGQITPLAKNDYWKALDKRLGAHLDSTIIPSDAYDQKVATILAGGDIPDITCVLPSAVTNKAIRQGAFADLSDVLGGDGIEQYPNIGWTREDQWKASVIDGGIFGVPIDVPLINGQLRIRMDWAKKLGFTAAPADADEYYEFMTGVPKGNLAGKGRKAFGLAAYGGAVSGNGDLNSIFRVPNQWRLEGGKLTHMFETDEFAQATEFAAKLWKGGGFHPDALALSQQGSKVLSMFTGGQLATLSIAANGWWQKPYVDVVEASEGGIVPFMLPGHDGKLGSVNFGSPFFGRMAISAEAAKDDKRLDELLSVINYFKAPFGSEERDFITYGPEGVYFESKNGKPEPKEGKDLAKDASALTYGYRPIVYESREHPEMAAELVSYMEKIYPVGVANPCDSIPSEVADKANPILEQVANDHLNQILVGRRPVTDLKKFVEEWRTRGGDDMRADFEKQLKERG